MGLCWEAFQEFEELNCLETCDGGSCRRQCWHNPSCLDLDRDPVHWSQSVILCSNIGHGINEIDVEICIVVLFKFFDCELLEQLILRCCKSCFQLDHFIIFCWSWTTLCCFLFLFTLLGHLLLNLLGFLVIGHELLDLKRRRSPSHFQL